MTKTKYHILENKNPCFFLFFFFFDIEYVLVDYPSNPMILWMPPYEALTVRGVEGVEDVESWAGGVRMWRMWCG